MDVARAAYVANVSETCCKSLFKMFYLFRRYVASVLIWMLHMFNTYVAIVCPKCFICSSLPLQQVFLCCRLQLFYLDVVYVFTHMLQVYVPDVSSVSDVCCIQVFHVGRVSCCSESQGARGSDGSTAQAPGNGALRAGGRRTWRATRWRPVVRGTARRGAPAGRGEWMRRGCTDGGGSNRGGRDGLRASRSDSTATRCACKQGKLVGGDRLCMRMLETAV